jgi:hypothetical protein
MALPDDGAVGTITLADGPDTREAHGTIRSFQDDDGTTRWEIQIDHEIIEDPRITAVGFVESDVIDFLPD